MQEFIEFVEGRMPFNEFRRNYETNKDYKKLLDDKKPNVSQDRYAHRDATIDKSSNHFQIGWQVLNSN